MKKMFLTAVAAIASTVLFAGAPTTIVTEQYLQENFDCVNNYVVAIWYDMNLTCVNEPYAIWAGTVNGWSNVNDENAITPEVLDGQYAGWFVFDFNDQSETVQGKPLVLDTEGKGSWDYQSGTPDTWIHKGGKEATITVGGQNPAESDLTWPEKGAYIYEITGLKNGANPCTAVYHNYTLKFYVPEFCDAQRGDGFNYEDSVHIDGGFDGWTTGIFMTSDVDEDGNTYYVASFRATEGTEFLVRLGTKDYTDKISGDSNLKTGMSDDTIYNFTDAEWSACAVEQEYTVTLKVPAFCTALAEYTEAVQIVGDFDGWTGTLMTKQSEGVYTWTGDAKSSFGFKFKLGDTWDYEILKYDGAAWNALSNIKFGQNATIDLDFSNADVYQWKGCEPTALENVTLAPAIRRVMVNGHMYINHNGKLINMLGF